MRRPFACFCRRRSRAKTSRAFAAGATRRGRIRHHRRFTVFDRAEPWSRCRPRGAHHQSARRSGRITRLATAVCVGEREPPMTGGGLGNKPRNVSNAAHELTWSTRNPAIFAVPVLTLCLIAFNSAQADSAASPEKPPRPRLLFVDADHPSTWPQGLEPIPAGELRKLLGAGNSPDPLPGGVQIEQAV